MTDVSSYIKNRA